MNWFLNLRTRAKLFWSFGLLVVLLLLITGTAYQTITALQDSHHGGFVFSPGSGNALRSFALVHVPRLTADKSLVCFAFAG